MWQTNTQPETLESIIKYTIYSIRNCISVNTIILMFVNMVHSTKGGGQLNITIIGLTLIQILMLQIVYVMSLSIMVHFLFCWYYICSYITTRAVLYILTLLPQFGKTQFHISRLFCTPDTEMYVTLQYCGMLHCKLVGRLIVHTNKYHIQPFVTIQVDMYLYLQCLYIQSNHIRN